MVCSMQRWRGKVAIVTGASAGIGAAIVEALVSHGLTVVGLARRKHKVEELAKKLENKEGKLYALKADITKESDILEAFKWVKENLYTIDILINNAGIVRYNSLITGDTKDWKDILDTNVLGLCIATREAASFMISNKIDGHIIHINSVSGHAVINAPNLNVYMASKFGVTALTEILRRELVAAGSKVRITSISPGYVESEIIQVSGLEMTEEIKNELNSAAILRAEDIADSVCYVLSTPPHVQIHELTIKPVGEIP